MNDKTIERTEKKYLVSKSEKTKILNDLEKYLKKDKYFSSTVLNLYFDTKNDDLIIISNDRPVFKQKFRLRSYNLPKPSDTVFLETKTKLKLKKEKIGNKRRLALSLKDFYNFMNHKTSLKRLFEDFDAEDYQIAKELDYLFNFYNLVPKIFIAYDRESYAGVGVNNAFRLTFDSNLRYRTSDLKIEAKSKEKLYFENLAKTVTSAESLKNPKNHKSTETSEKNIIMEVKTLNSMPLWFVKELSKLKLYPSSFSKYGKIFNKLTERKNNVF